ncbi:LANO_0F15192g1_1 [Lachancea nothofagi CBS 11611]|uniref:LANO_0F15192g1_1 n=1 Tax=Lachancea nothofagi CBS 11611 TaxID=1266666 RepID=A0A1G4KCU5_9SACH|nr:LANO_0F15192g1_1 [Lachancea nothofagi CBS 11611]
MDHLQSLERSLPPESAVDDQNIDKLNQQVTQEFKIAANAVTNLYRLSSERSSLNRHMGYVDCLDDVMELLDKGFSVHDLAKWCKDRKQEKVGKGTLQKANASEIDLKSTRNSTSRDTSSITSPTFRLSRPIMSVERGSKRCVKPQLTERFAQQRGNAPIPGDAKRKTKKVKPKVNELVILESSQTFHVTKPK